MLESLKGRDFLKLLDYTEDEILYLISLAEDFKKKKEEGIEHKYLKGKNVHYYLKKILLELDVLLK